MVDTADVLMVELDGVDAGEASLHATELREYLLAEDPDLDIEQVRARSDNQDLGAALAILSATPAVVVLARGVQRWIALRSTASVIFKSGDRQLKVTNLAGWRADRISRELADLLRDEEPAG